MNAGGREPLRTELARAIGGRKWHDHHVTTFDAADLAADRLHDADGFMANALADIAFGQLFEWPEVAAADAGAHDAQDRVGRFHDRRVRDVFDANIAGAVHEG